MAGGDSRQFSAENAAIEQDPAIIEYFNDIRGRRGNDGHLSKYTRWDTLKAIKDFLRYTGIEVTNHAISDLIAYKQNNPKSHDIEHALRAYSNEPPIKKRRTCGSRILGIFRVNYARLDVRINTHFEPAIENCTFPIFLQIHEALTPEQRHMVQWGVYYPERATATYRIPFSAFTKIGNYAVAWVETHHPEYSNKSRVRHPAIIPLAFFELVESKAKAAGRTCPFPNYRAEWKEITAFANKGFKVRLVSNHTRKVFEKLAGRARLNPAAAAFLMGDKTKLNNTGHLPLIYNPDLRQLDEIIQAYENVDMAEYLNLDKSAPLFPGNLQKLRIRGQIRYWQGCEAVGANTGHMSKTTAMHPHQNR